MMAAFAGHVLATRIIPRLYNFPVDFQIVVATLAYPTGLFFYPYYVLLGSTGVYHSVYGTIRAASVFGVKVPENMRTKSFAFKTAVMLGALGILGSVTRITFFPNDRLHEIFAFQDKVMSSVFK